MKMVNIGCGPVFHRGWVNLDVAPTDRAVRRYDARRALPFSDASVDVVYHSHLLEHLSRNDAKKFLLECFRILKPGGTMRIAVPDLEGIARAYLQALDQVRAGGEPTLYEWTRLELVDQLARERSGGEMAEFLKGLGTGQIAIVRTRAGSEIDGHIRGARETAPWQITWGKVIRRARLLLVQAAAGLVGGRTMIRALNAGVFRHRGEVHRVMYDEYSLARILTDVGFSAPVRMTASKSNIPDFDRYALDVSEGAVRKPDSLFMECAKP